MVKILELEQITCNGMRNSNMTTFVSGSSKLRDGEIHLKDMHDESCSSCYQRQKFLPETNATCTKTSSSILRFIRERFKASTSKIRKAKEKTYEGKQTEKAVPSNVGTSGTTRTKSCGHIENVVSSRPGKFKTRAERRSKLGKCESEPLQKYKTTDNVVTTTRTVRKVRRIANTCNVIYLCIFHKRKRRKQSSQIVQTEPWNSVPTAQGFCDRCNVRYNTVFWTSELVAVNQSTSESYYNSSEETLSKASSTCCDSDQNKRVIKDVLKFPIRVYPEKRKGMVNPLETKTVSNSSFVCFDSDDTKTETDHETELSFNLYSQRSEDEADIFKKLRPSESNSLCLDKDEFGNVIKPFTYDRFSERNVNTLDDISSKRDSLGRNVKMEIYNGIQALCKKSWFGKSCRKKPKRADVQVTPVIENVRQRDASCNCSENRADSAKRYTEGPYKPNRHRSHKRTQSGASDISTDDADSTACNTRVGSYCGSYANSCKRRTPRNKYYEYRDNEEEERIPETSKSRLLDESIESEGDTSSRLRKDKSRGASKISSGQDETDGYHEIYRKQSLKHVVARGSGSHLHLDGSRIKSSDRQEIITEKSKPEAHEGKSEQKADSRRKMSSFSESRLQDERSRMKRYDPRDIPEKEHESKIHNGKENAKTGIPRKMSPRSSASSLVDQRSKLKSTDKKEIPADEHKTEVHNCRVPAKEEKGAEEPQRSRASHLENEENNMKSRKEGQTEKHKAEIDGGAPHLHASRSLLDIPSERRKSDTSKADTDNERKPSKRLSATLSKEENNKEKVEETDSAMETRGYCSSCCKKAKAKAAKVVEAVGKKAKRNKSSDREENGEQSVVLSVTSTTDLPKAGSRMENLSAEGWSDQILKPSISHSHPDRVSPTKASKENWFDAISEQDEQNLLARTSTESIPDAKNEESTYATTEVAPTSSLLPDLETTAHTPWFVDGGERDHKRIPQADKYVQSTKENILLPEFLEKETNVLDGIAALLNQIFQEISKQPFRKCICKISQTPNKQGLLNAANHDKGYQTALYVIRKKVVQDEESLLPIKLGEPRKTLTINTDKLKLEIKTDEDGNWLIDRVGNLEITIAEKQDAKARFTEKLTNTDGVELRCTSCLCVLASKPDIPKESKDKIGENDTTSNKSTTTILQTQKTPELVPSAKYFDPMTKTQETILSTKDSETIPKTQELNLSQIASKSTQKPPEFELSEKTSAKTQTLPDMVLLEEYSDQINKTSGQIQETSKLPFSSKSSDQTKKTSDKSTQQIPEIVITRAPSEPIIHKAPELVSSKHTLKPPVQQTRKLPKKSLKQTPTTSKLAVSKSTLKPTQQKSSTSEKSSKHIQKTLKQVPTEQQLKQDQKKSKTKASETPELQPHAVIHVYKKIAGAKHLPDDDPRNFVVKIKFHPSDSDTPSEEIKSQLKSNLPVIEGRCPGNGTCCRCDRKRSSPPTSALLFKRLKSTTTENTLTPSSCEKCSIVELPSPSQDSYMKKVNVCVPKRNAGSQALIKHHVMQQCPEMMNAKSQTRRSCVKCACPAVAPILPDGQKTCCS